MLIFSAENFTYLFLSFVAVSTARGKQIKFKMISSNTRVRAHTSTHRGLLMTFKLYVMASIQIAD